jgi:hypothetical protein
MRLFCLLLLCLMDSSTARKKRVFVEDRPFAANATAAFPAAANATGSERKTRVFMVGGDQTRSVGGWTEESASRSAMETTVLPEEGAFQFALATQMAAGEGRQRGSVTRNRTGNRTDWNGLESAEQMRRAIDAAKNLKPAEQTKSALRALARLHDIPENTFLRRMASPEPYATPTLGRPEGLNALCKEAVADGVARADELHQGRSTGAILDSMVETFPDHTRKQLSNVWQHSIKKKT